MNTFFLRDRCKTLHLFEIIELNFFSYFPSWTPSYSMYLYHLKPPHLIGNILYPLNQLRQFAPDVYKNEMKKYDGREWLINSPLPIENVTWNGCVHFSPIDIGEILLKTISVMRLHGLDLDAYGERFRRRRYYRVNSELLDQEKLYIFFNPNSATPKKPLISQSDQFILFHHGKNQVSLNINKRHMNYLHEQAAKEKRPLLFMYLPHVLYSSAVNLDVAEEMEWVR